MCVSRLLARAFSFLFVLNTLSLSTPVYIHTHIVCATLKKTQLNFFYFFHHVVEKPSYRLGA